MLELALWLVAQAIILGGGLLGQALEWLVHGKRQDVTLRWPWDETDQLERRSAIFPAGAVLLGAMGTLKRKGPDGNGKRDQSTTPVPQDHWSKC